MPPRVRVVLKHMLTILFIVISTVAILEAALAVFDPTGVIYMNEISALFFRDTARPDPRGYRVTPGEHHGRYWSFTIQPDGTRLTPDTNPGAARTAVFIGDSLTFGYGVNDRDVWVNLLARDFTDWQLINPSMPAFNAENYARTFDLYPDADVIFVVTIPNDLTAGAYIAPFEPPPIYAYVDLYLRTLQGRLAPPPLNEAELRDVSVKWEASLRRMAADPRVHVITFPGAYAQQVARVVPNVSTVGYFTSTVSKIDPHASIAGNRELYESMLPVVRAVLGN